MSLISLLIALAAERSLSSATWQFNTYYQYYLKVIKLFDVNLKISSNFLFSLVFIAIPVIACSMILAIFDNAVLHLILSTLVLIVCFGCFKTRDTYKQYLMSAFRGEPTSCDLHHQQLQQDKNLAGLSFGHMLIWLNYRYFIAIMFFFVLFGAPGALFYRLLATVVENKHNFDSENENEEVPMTDDSDESPKVAENQSDYFTQLLAVIDWIPIRLVTLGYVFVGDFSKAIPAWLDNLFNVDKKTHQVLIEVAEKAEDFTPDDSLDCTAEPCLLVRLAKRTSLLCLTILSLLILLGVIH